MLYPSMLNIKQESYEYQFSLPLIQPDWDSYPSLPFEKADALCILIDVYRDFLRCHVI